MGNGLLFQIGAIVVLLGGLIFIHELGHFLAAKYFRVKVLKFSIGFGPKILGFRRGETEYRLSLLPLGGYVKMAGDDPTETVAPEDRGRGYLEQKPWRRIVIAFAGPGMNLIFPLLAYFVVFAGQREQIAAHVGQVLPDMPAWKAGLQPGDRVVEIAGEPVYAWSDLQRLVAPSPGKPLAFVVERDGQRVSTTVTPEAYEESDPIETQLVGKIGIISAPAAPVIGLARAEGPLFEAGLRSLDRIVSVAGVAVNTQDEVLKALAARAKEGKPFAVVALRDEGLPLGVFQAAVPQRLDVTVTPREGAELFAEPTRAYVTHLVPGSPAAQAGLGRGDRLVSIDGAPVLSWEKLDRALVEKKDAPFELEFLSAGVVKKVTVAQAVQRDHDEIKDREIIRYTFGAYSRVPSVPTPTVTVPFRPGLAAVTAVESTWEVGRKIVLGIVMIVTGEIAFKNVGGPLQIFDITTRAAEAGWDTFLHTMALISLNLGLINLFPVPVLDGGHIVQATIEAIRRKPLSLRAREISNLVGLAMLLTLMVFVLKNDVVRYFLTG